MTLLKFLHNQQAHSSQHLHTIFTRVMSQISWFDSCYLLFGDQPTQCWHHIGIHVPQHGMFVICHDEILKSTVILKLCSQEGEVVWRPRPHHRWLPWVHDAGEVRPGHRWARERAARWTLPGLRSTISVARWQILIPSFLWIVLGWRAGMHPRPPP